ncbi:hypothetical protein [Butyricicoccus pullicaecorum]|uniref:Uncharacterized protein n=1 Tax=Butyricicoccus pullicaecorum TaxID=501571 RepID=A0A1Y4LVH7_9FIRM|nr:hypothetical protein [Butyricicoccus pullicaecorum]OUP59051.1 hypothetical protein B5F15_06170 [Butyricicoccus pullicaecorum]
MEDKILTRRISEGDYAADINYQSETVELSVYGQASSFELELSELGNYIQFLDAVNKRMGE